MSLRTPLKNARGLGSAKDGTEHWWAQRVTSLALIPLTLWFVYSMFGLSGAGYAEVTGWLANPWQGAGLALFFGVLLYHSNLGLQIILEDYVHLEWLKITSLLLSTLVHLFLGAGLVIAVLRFTLGG